MRSPTLSVSIRLLGLVVAALLAGLIAAPIAGAHGEGESDESLVLVRQAIALLVNKPGDLMAVKDKMNDGLEARHQEGVNLAMVRQAMDMMPGEQLGSDMMMSSGDMMQVRTLLEKSIGARPIVGGEDPVQIGDVPPPLTGEDTGTLVVLVVAAAPEVVEDDVRGSSAMTQTAGPQPFVPPGVVIDPVAKNRARRVREAIDERLGIDAIRYPVPEHANKVAYSLGGLTAFSLLILIVTGIVLAQYYNPDPVAANESVRHIVNSVYLGRFVRGLHFWASEAMYVLAILHLLRIYLTGSYKRPREANWLIGVGMFSLIVGAMFTGTVLKWDQEGFEALGHNLELSRLLGGIGFWFTSGFSSHVPLLIRLYVAHVSIIPMLIIGLLVLHTLLVKRHKISPSPRNPDAVRERVAPFTHHLRRIGALGLILLGGLSILAIAFPPGVGPNPVEGIEVTKPPWM